MKSGETACFNDQPGAAVADGVTADGMKHFFCRGQACAVAGDEEFGLPAAHDVEGFFKPFFAGLKQVHTAHDAADFFYA